MKINESVRVPMLGTPEYKAFEKEFLSQVPRNRHKEAKKLLIELSDRRHSGRFKKGAPRSYFYKTSAHHVKTKTVRQPVKFDKEVRLEVKG